MSDLHLNFGLQPHERHGDDDAREARHQVLATLLGAYADGELPPETASQIDAHLLGCVRCRREVDLHAVMRERLGRELQPVASAALRARIAARIEGLPPLPAVAGGAVPNRWWRLTSARVIAVVLLLGGVAMPGIRGLSPGTPSVDSTALATVNAAGVPLLASILTDYRSVMSGDLPGRARDLDAVRAAVPFPVEPLHSPTLRLLAAWTTDLGGDPAAVLAYRWHDRIVLEYIVAEPVFFRHPGMRAPVAAGLLVAAESEGQSVLAWPSPESGVVFVADASVAALEALRPAARAR